MRWLTFFPSIENVHLTKDVGLIPWYAGQHGYTPTLAGRFSTDESYPALQDEVHGLELLSLPQGGARRGAWPWFRYLDKGFVAYLRKSADRCDVLHLFHLSRDTIAYGALYKRINPRGKLYVKLDAYNAHLVSRKRYSKNKLKDRVLRRVERAFLRGVDVVSVENTKGLELVAKVYPELRDKLMYLPNGANDLYLSRRFESVGADAKENLFLSVGRPGSADKNYELLLRALPMLEWAGWRMAVVGPITEEFRLKTAELFDRHPGLKDKVDFIGGIDDRETLYGWYRRAKVFFLPSKSESFGIAYAEALYFGCALVGHDEMSAYDDLSDRGRWGTYFINDDEYALARALREAAERTDAPDFIVGVRQHAATHFYWSRIIPRLLERLAADTTTTAGSGSDDRITKDSA